jgi:hypothetical protein
MTLQGAWLLGSRIVQVTWCPPRGSPPRSGLSKTIIHRCRWRRGTFTRLSEGAELWLFVEADGAGSSRKQPDGERRTIQSGICVAPQEYWTSRPGACLGCVRRRVGRFLRLLLRRKTSRTGRRRSSSSAAWAKLGIKESSNQSQAAAPLGDYGQLESGPASMWSGGRCGGPCRERRADPAVTCASTRFAA